MSCTERRSVAFLSIHHSRAVLPAVPTSLTHCACAIASFLNGCENKVKKLRISATADHTETFLAQHDVNKQHMSDATDTDDKEQDYKNSRFKAKSFSGFNY